MTRGSGFRVRLLAATLLLFCGTAAAQQPQPEPTSPSAPLQQLPTTRVPGFKFTVYGNPRSESTARKILLAPVRELKRTAVDMITCRDRVFCGAAWFYVAAYSADMISTNAAFARCPTCIETGLYFHGSRAAGPIAAASGAVTISNLTLAHFWKRRVKEPVLHNVWAGDLTAMTIAHAGAAHHNSQVTDLAPAP